MHFSSHRNFSLFAVLFVFLSLAFSAAAAIPENFVFIKDTSSPDGVYSLGWGYKLPGVDFARLNKDDQEYFSTIPEENTVENYIVNNASLTIACKIENSDYFEIGEMVKSHASLVCAWSEDSRILFYGLNSRWETDSLALYKASSDGAFARFEIIDAVEYEVREYLKNKHAKGYKNYAESIVISYYDLKISNDGQLGIVVSVEVPKQEEFCFSLAMVCKTDFSATLPVKLQSVEIKEQK